MLCNRCEHRAVFIEKSQRQKIDKSVHVPRPRFQCGNTEMSLIGCYMYRPVRPVVFIKSDPDDPRPLFGPAILSSRFRAIRIAQNIELMKFSTEEQHYLYWVPEKDEAEEHLCTCRFGRLVRVLFCIEHCSACGGYTFKTIDD